MSNGFHCLVWLCVTAALNVRLNDAVALVTHQAAQSAVEGRWSCSQCPVIISNGAYSCLFTHTHTHTGQYMCHYRGYHLFWINCLYICTWLAHLLLFPLMRGQIFEYSLPLFSSTHRHLRCAAQKLPTLHLEPHIFPSKAHFASIYKLYLM